MSQYKSGVLFTVVGALLWGISGTSGQFLLQQRGLTSGWLVAVRMLMAGLILLVLCYKKEKDAIFRVWKEKHDRRDLFLFAALGLSFCQYTYFATISHSNAGTATVLQFLAPVLIMIYLSVKNRKLPRTAEMVAIVFAVAGIFLLATHGRFDSLAISQEALMYGLLSAVSVVIYNLQPARLIKTYGTLLSLGWGMLIGGVLLSIVYQPWRIIGTWDLAAFASLLVIILLGTVISFSLYLEGVHRIGATVGSLLSSAEPLSATFLSVFWLGTTLDWTDLIGIALILSTVFLLTLKSKPLKSSEVIQTELNI
ncbi:threonine/homoserine efflux transporter RhtA [Trichococcus patagoniensis]|uniref:Threonine/homoserine efflux transporter RhtA n=1 Tax=Trichococcus patagoniensis TaxID=382641 RepID=A0A2T5IPG0_9LACT|nr:EamA family transporter [Trichococcus patagoniensis]PTQ85706.1 threonine/homoserine efflux transporter RhtA [Trichococcus patagoniensis]